MSTLRLTTIANQGNTASVPSETVINGSAKAWVNFNGTGTVAIRASFNVSSITDNGTGDYTANFTNALTDANYSFSVNASSPAVSSGTVDAPSNVTPTTSAFRFRTFAYNGATLTDMTYCSVTVFR